LSTTFLIQHFLTFFIFKIKNAFLTFFILRVNVFTSMADREVEGDRDTHCDKERYRARSRHTKQWIPRWWNFASLQTSIYPLFKELT